MTIPFGTSVRLPLYGIDVQTTTLMPDGEVVLVNGGMVYGQPSRGTKTIMIGVHPDDSPSVIARRIVREGLRDVLAWLDKPPSMLTGREVLDKLAGRPVWSAR